MVEPDLIAYRGDVHRNTLIYRLNKIAKLTGRPERDYRGALALYLACLSDQLSDDR